MVIMSPLLEVEVPPAAFTWIDAVVATLFVAAVCAAWHFGKGMLMHLNPSATPPIDTSIAFMPLDAARTLLRMWIAIAWQQSTECEQEETNPSIARSECGPIRRWWRRTRKCPNLASLSPRRAAYSCIRRSRPPDSSSVDSGARGFCVPAAARRDTAARAERPSGCWPEAIQKPSASCS